MQPPLPADQNGASPFAGFWMGGFEGADHVNARGDRLDLLRDSGHLAHLEADHARAAALGIRAVRESIGWRIAQPHAAAPIDLARARRIARSAQASGLQVLWTLMHYGTPDGVSVHDDRLIDAFARFAGRVAEELGALSPRAPVYTPINEIGFLSWAAARHGLLHGAVNVAPAGGIDVGYAVKRRLVRAALAGMQQMTDIDPRARFMHVEPVVHVVPDARDVAGTRARASEEGGWQWQAWDLIAGRAEPALGGAMRWLDLLGANHYHDSQWALGGGALSWAGGDARRLPQSALLQQAWQRYRRPVVLAETSHSGVGRADWLHDTCAALRQAHDDGTPVEGLCWYPLVDRPDWVEPQRWHRSGLWHVDPATQRRVADEPVHAAWRAWQAALPASAAAPTVPAVSAVSAVSAPHAAGVAAAPGRPRVLVFSHLRWDFVRHRTRQLMDAMAGERDIVYVEEPRRATPAEGQGFGPDRLHVRAAGPSVTIIEPRLSPAAVNADCSFEAAASAAWAGLLRQWLHDHPGGPVTLWLTTPLAAALAHGLPHQRCVYDCADALHAFAGASPALPGCEAGLLRSADHVFAATPALVAHCRGAAAAPVQLLPNGVDTTHFARVAAVRAGAGWRCWEAHEAAQIMAAAGLPPDAAPFIGYAGVIDERLDTALLATLCDALPDQPFLLVGPVVKIDPAALPQRSNLHLLGPVPYRVLPWLMSRWRLSMLPFRIDAITRPAMPLKVLEALAAGLPVVATALPELRAWHGAGVVSASSAQDFVDALRLPAGNALSPLSRSCGAPALEARDWHSLAWAALAQTGHDMAHRLPFERDSPLHPTLDLSCPPLPVPPAPHPARAPTSSNSSRPTTSA